MTQLVLSVFPGIGLLDMAFEEEGFCVVRGPDLLWGGDIKRFHPPAGKFEGVIGGPPCQAFSPLQRLVQHNRAKARANGDTRTYKEAENLIPEFERVVDEARPEWFLMENVPTAPTAGSPLHFIAGRVINNRWFGAAQNRERRFTFGALEELQTARWERALAEQLVLLESAEYAPAVCASGSTWQPARIGGSGKPKRGRVYGCKSAAYTSAATKLQGLPEGFLEDSPFTVRERLRVIGNGVPLPMGRAVARAVKRAIGYQEATGTKEGA